MPASKSSETALTLDVREAARRLGGLAVDTLGKIMKGEGSDAAKLGAAREVLDRGYGKARAADEAEAEAVTVVIRRFGDDEAAD